MNVIYIGYHKLRCTKNGQSYDIEFFELNDNMKNNKQNNINNNNIYYYTITSKVCNNKKLMKVISKIIYSKFNLQRKKHI